MPVRLLSSCAVLAISATTALADYSLTILHTNDFHDRFEPISKYDSTCGAEDNEAGDCFGGIARMVTAVDQARAGIEGDSLLLDAGDMFQGSLFFTEYGGDLAAEFMSMIGYDAMAVGNHEFDKGPSGLADFLDQVDFPVLSANIDVSGEERLAGRVGKSVVLTPGEEKIGIVSVLAEDTPDTSSPGDNVIFSSSIDAAQAEIDALTAEGVDKIILLTHVGLPQDRRLAEALTGVDVIIGGHSHTLLGDMDGAEGSYPTMVGDTPIVTAYAYGKYLGEFTVTFDDDGKVTDFSGAPMLIDASIAEDEAAKARVAELAGPLEEMRTTVIGATSEAIDGERGSCRAGECQMGTLVTDAMLDRVAGQGVTIAITNGGGLRASIDEGEVTMGEVYTVLPFQNTLATFEATGETLIAALENGVGQVEDGAGRFPQVAGMTFTFDLSQEPGSRISDVMVAEGDAWAPIDPAATYLVATNNYVRNGGDGYSMFEDAENAYDFGPDLAELLADYVEANSPYEPYTAGRISQAE